MKRTFLTLTLVAAAQLVATGAFAQTSATTTTGAADSGMTSARFGSDWSSALGSAFFGEGGTTLRSESELASQWGTLSEEDKEMVRRDCMAYTQQSGDTTGATGTSAGSTGTSTTGSTGSGTDTSTTGSSGATTDSTATTAGSTGGATETTGAQTGASGTTSGTSATGTSPMINVTMEQMEQICAATDDL